MTEVPPSPRALLPQDARSSLTRSQHLDSDHKRKSSACLLCEQISLKAQVSRCELWWEEDYATGRRVIPTGLHKNKALRQLVDDKNYMRAITFHRPAVNVMNNQNIPGPARSVRTDSATVAISEVPLQDVCTDSEPHHRHSGPRLSRVRHTPGMNVSNCVKVMSDFLRRRG